MRLLKLSKAQDSGATDIGKAHSKLINELSLEIALHPNLYGFHHMWQRERTDYWRAERQEHVFRITYTAYWSNKWLMSDVPNDDKVKNRILTLRFISKLQYKQGVLVWKLRSIFYTEGYTSEMLIFPKMHKQAEIVLEFPGVTPAQVSANKQLASSIAERMCEKLVKEFFFPINFAPLLIASAYYATQENLKGAVNSLNMDSALHRKGQILNEVLSPCGLAVSTIDITCWRNRDRPSHEPPLLLYTLLIGVIRKDERINRSSSYDLLVTLAFSIEVSKIFIEDEFKTIGAQLNLLDVSVYPTHYHAIGKIRLGENEETKAYVSLDLAAPYAKVHGDINNALSFIIHQYTTKWMILHGEEIAKAIHDIMRQYIERRKLTKSHTFTKLIKARY